jgi:hypothetical protein
VQPEYAEPRPSYDYGRSRDNMSHSRDRSWSPHRETGGPDGAPRVRGRGAPRFGVEEGPGGGPPPPGAGWQQRPPPPQAWERGRSMSRCACWVKINAHVALRGVVLLVALLILLVALLYHQN